MDLLCSIAGITIDKSYYHDPFRMKTQYTQKCIFQPRYKAEHIPANSVIPARFFHRRGPAVRTKRASCI